MNNVSELTGETQKQATGAARAARGMIASQIDIRRNIAGSMLARHAANLHRMSDSLTTQGQETPARLADAAATRLRTVSNYMRETDGDRMIDDLESFGRRNALLTGAIGFIGGLAAARLLKAGAQKRYRNEGPESDGYRFHD